MSRTTGGPGRAAGRRTGPPAAYGSQLSTREATPASYRTDEIRVLTRRADLLSASADCGRKVHSL
jgi:hypothetical protein